MMSDEIKLEGLGVAPGVIDTIVTLAAEAVEGVAAVGAPGLAGLVQKGVAKGAGRAVDVAATDEGAVEVIVHVQVFYGQQLLEVGRKVQSGVADAIASQVGVPVSAVNVYIDGICFEK
jgi:uncharacterized alkaline shock family protein YloU